MKSKKVFTSIFTALILCSFLGAFATTQSINALVVNPDSWFYASPYVVMNGYQPELSVKSPLMSFKIGLDVVYNSSVPAVSLVGDTFFEQSIASNDYVTDGITREFSGDISSKLDIDSAAGMYQTLQTINENDFSQYAIERDTTVFTYTTDTPFNETITNELSDFDPDWTYLNFTCATMYVVLTFDRTAVDTFFAQAKAKDGYSLVSDEHSTNAQMITTLLDDVWSDHIFDIIYSPINMSLLETDITIAEEVHAVMGANATDTSINGTTRIVSMRDASVGFIGQKLASESTIEKAHPPIETHSPFFKFEATAVSYTLYLDVKSDYATGDTLDGNLSALFSLLQPGDETTGLLTSINIGWALFVGLLTAFVIGVITYLIAKDNKNRAALAILVGLVVGVLASGAYIAVTAFLNLTVI